MRHAHYIHPPELVAAVRELWQTDFTAREIAYEINRRFGTTTTRNGIIAVARRNDFGPKPKALPPRRPHTIPEDPMSRTRIFTPELMARARGLAATGLSATEAAKRLGVKLSSLKQSSAHPADDTKPIRWMGKPHQAAAANR